MLILAVTAIVFFASFTQSVVGFGTAMVGMPLMVTVLGIQTSAPLIALLGLTLETIMLLHYRQSVSLTVMWRLIVAAVVGIPLGVLAIQRIPEDIVLTLLGLVIAGYAIYGLLRLRMPELRSNLWAYGAGFLSGILGGAYNTAGPPVVIYGHCKRWPPEEFRGNLQGFFLVIDLLVVANHAVLGNMTPDVWRNYLLALVPLFLGFVIGTRFATRIDPAVYSRIVLVMLVILGVRLIF
ncbi:MAG TPA: sulfite exporter TauE/SafE family protein [Anaerolineae bacterium]|nr:sulfite exporter TauE/SafE family protein [Anaerolineae bacterium]